MKPVEGSRTTFKTGVVAGLINGISHLPIVGTHGGDKVTLQLRAWDSQGGMIGSWAEMVKSYFARGRSVLITNYELAGQDAEGVQHVGSGNLAAAGLNSFVIWPIPEPTPLALMILGLLALRIRRKGDS